MSKSKYRAEIEQMTVSEAFKKQTVQLLSHAASSQAEPQQKSRRSYWKSAIVVSVLCVALVAAIWQLPGFFTRDSDKLPLLPLSFQGEGMGFEGLLVYEVKELEGGNPWYQAAELTTLPVFTNTFTYVDGTPTGGLSQEEMLERGEEVASALQETIRSVSSDPFHSSVTTDDSLIRVNRRGEVVISFNEPLPVIDDEAWGQAVVAGEDYGNMIIELLTQFAAIVPMESPALDIGLTYSFNGEPHWRYSAYESAGDLTEQIIAYNFNPVAFNIYEGSLTSISLSLPDLSHRIGDYPIISAEEAADKLMEGNYFTTAPYDFSEEREISLVELVYRSGDYGEVFMPFYKFYVDLPEEKLENGLHMYGVYYVPAVSSQYLMDYQEAEVYFN